MRSSGGEAEARLEAKRRHQVPPLGWGWGRDSRNLLSWGKSVGERGQMEADSKSKEISSRI